MFGPNVKAIVHPFGTIESEKYYCHHREDKFRDIVKSLKRVFTEKFGLQDYELMFVNGSGTFVNEIVIASCNRVLDAFYADGEFGKRLEQTSYYWNCYRHKLRDENFKAACMPVYETSMARKNDVDVESDFMFHDMVSAFPYWLPEKCDVFTTVSSKQLGAYPVIGIIGVKKSLELEKYFELLPGTCLSFDDHWLASEKNESLHTPSIPLYQDLLNRVTLFDRVGFVRKISLRHNDLKTILSRHCYGDGPVLNLIPCDYVDKIADEFNLYRNVNGEPQIYLYSGSDEDFEKLCKFCEIYHE